MESPSSDLLPSRSLVQYPNKEKGSALEEVWVSERRVVLTRVTMSLTTRWVVEVEPDWTDQPQAGEEEEVEAGEPVASGR